MPEVASICQLPLDGSFLSPADNFWNDFFTPPTVFFWNRSSDIALSFQSRLRSR
jgi:hypothetical protein